MKKVFLGLAIAFYSAGFYFVFLVFGKVYWPAFIPWGIMGTMLVATCIWVFISDRKRKKRLGHSAKVEDHKLQLQKRIGGGQKELEDIVKEGVSK